MSSTSLDAIGHYLTLRWVDVVDIAVVAVLLWFLIQGARRTRARRALVGLATLGAVFLLARQLNLQLTARLLQGFFAVLVVILVVVFPGNGAPVRWRWREALVAVGLAAALWLLVIPGAGVVEVQRDVSVSVSHTPKGHMIELIDPPRVRVTLAGRRADLFLPTAEPRVRLDGLQIRLGRRLFELSRSDVEVPPGIEVLAVDPPRVRVEVSAIAAGETQ